MVTIKEKLDLATELNLPAQMSKLVEVALINSIADIKFKIITPDQIEKKITDGVFYEEVEKKTKHRFWCGYKSEAIHDCNCPTKTNKLKKQARLSSVRLDYWSEELPYGALLAVKEAKEKGFKHFDIYFPATEKEWLRRQDPVIVGYFFTTKMSSFSGFSFGPEIGKGNMYEIFSWDDSKVYE